MADVIGKSIKRLLDLSESEWVIPAGQWHTVHALESGTVILEVKDGKYEPIQDCDVLKM